MKRAALSSQKELLFQQSGGRGYWIFDGNGFWRNNCELQRAGCDLHTSAKAYATQIGTKTNRLHENKLVTQQVKFWQTPGR